MEAPTERGPVAATVAGAGVGILGGLFGLGGAEFRLPLVVTIFRYTLRRAIGRDRRALARAVTPSVGALAFPPAGRTVRVARRPAAREG